MTVRRISVRCSSLSRTFPPEALACRPSRPLRPRWAVVFSRPTPLRSAAVWPLCFSRSIRLRSVAGVFWRLIRLSAALGPLAFWV